MEVPDREIPHERSNYTGKCPTCGFEIRKRLISGSSVPITKTGDYGSNGTPAPSAFADEMYEATSISFVAASSPTPAYLSDSSCLFGEKHFSSGMTLRVSTTSGTNDGDFTIADRGVTRDQILLSSSDSLTTESASTAGTVTLSQVSYAPSVSTGCGFCGSLNTK